MRRLIIGIVLLLSSTTAFAQRAGDWVSSPTTGCIGGSTCREKRLRVELQDRPVVSVRFRAHDQVGQKADGALRVKIDGNTVEGYLDIPRRGEVFTIDVDELRGRFLVFEAANDDEVEISEIAVLYGRNDTMRRIPRDRDWDRDDRRGDWERGNSGAGGWKQYPRAGMCIGGDECRKNGRRITVALDNRPVLGVRFYAHDAIGTRADGKLNVRIDDQSIGAYDDVQRAGKRHEYDVDNVVGSRLVIETANDDEVDVKDIEVLYGRGGGGGGRGPGGGGGYGGAREITDEGGCIGGDECGGRRARIRIPLRGRAVESLRFYARDDIGARAGGRLQISIDDEVVQYSLDIPREGKTFTIDCRNIAGDFLIIEPADDDEVDIKDIRVTLRSRD